MDGRECLQEGGAVVRRSCAANPDSDLVRLPIEVEEAIAESSGRHVSLPPVLVEAERKMEPCQCARRAKRYPERHLKHNAGPACMEG